jgi:uncharacterized protein
MASQITPHLSQTPPAPNPAFFGPQGLRAGWRILIFFSVVGALLFAFFVAIGLAAARFPSVLDRAQAIEDNARNGVVKVQPIDQMVIEAVLALAVVVAAAIMTAVEKRPFADYGLPANQAFGKRFWQGAPLGFGMLSLLLGAIWALHGFSLEGLAQSGASAVKYALLWAIFFFLVAIFEDFTFRGYLQTTLGDGIGFWPAAILLGVAFGALHWNNKGEALFGCVMAGSYGFLEAFALKRTGNLWLPVGMHAAWDWGETYFYGTPDSGAIGAGHLCNSTFHGAPWLTGGTVGPEGSWLVFAVLLVWALVIHWLFPAKQATA